MKEKLKNLFEREKDIKTKPLFIFELANNHGGDVNKGLETIKRINESCAEFNEDFMFGFKFQYRDLDTFIHPDYRDRKDIKFIKRFSDTRLKEEEFKMMKDEIDRLERVSICTPFDEKSVDLIEKHGFDIIKVASCSFTDWPLLERIVQSDKPIIASTAGTTLDEIDRVVAFFLNRNKKFSLMHCVAEYPTENKNLQLNQIDLLRNRYPNINIGFSTHENPYNLDSIKMAIAKGALIFEKHVAIGEDRNAYSADPEQVKKWLVSASESFKMAGIAGGRVEVTEKEKQDLRNLRRAVFTSQDIAIGKKVERKDVFLAIPSLEGQILANDLSKYANYHARTNIPRNGPVLLEDLNIVDTREKIKKIVYGDIKSMLSRANLPLKGIVDLEISHHYGIDRFYEYGCVMINQINREYCKKLILVLPGQTNPIHTHKIKEESFVVNYGDVLLDLDGIKKEYQRGDIVLVKPGMKHSFSSKNGGVFEEISTTHYKDDSYYDDESIMKNSERKTYVKLGLDN